MVRRGVDVDMPSNAEQPYSFVTCVRALMCRGIAGGISTAKGTEIARGRRAYLEGGKGAKHVNGVHQLLVLCLTALCRLAATSLALLALALLLQTSICILNICRHLSFVGPVHVRLASEHSKAADVVARERTEPLILANAAELSHFCLYIGTAKRATRRHH